MRDITPVTCSWSDRLSALRFINALWSFTKSTFIILFSCSLPINPIRSSIPIFSTYIWVPLPVTQPPGIVIANIGWIPLNGVWLFYTVSFPIPNVSCRGICIATLRDTGLVPRLVMLRIPLSFACVLLPMHNYLHYSSVTYHACGLRQFYLSVVPVAASSTLMALTLLLYSRMNMNNISQKPNLF